MLTHCHALCFSKGGLWGIFARSKKLNVLKTYRTIIFLLVSLITFVAEAQITSSVQTGMASYYADKFVGRKTASGEKFSQKKYTCAHRTLPFGTKLRVTNPNNNKSIIVTVNDRGPYAKNRIIDLSKTGAQELDFVKAGVANVLVEIIPDEEDALDDANCLAINTEPVKLNDVSHVGEYSAASEVDTFTIAMGTFKTEQDADSMIARVSAELEREATTKTIQNKNTTLYLVFVGMFFKRDEADSYLDKIETYYPNAEVAELTN